MPTPLRAHLLRATLTATTLLAAAAPAASASPPPNLLGLEVLSLDVQNRTVTGKQHCVQPENAGVTRTFRIGLSDFGPSQFPVGSLMGIEVDWTQDPPVIHRFGPTPCNARPQHPGPQAPWPGGGGHGGGPNGGPAGPHPGGGPMPGMPNGGPPHPRGPGPDAGPDGGPQGGDDHEMDKKFLSRVWKFTGQADGFSKDALSMTLEKILNLPKSMAKADDEMVDEDALVLIGSATRVYDGSKSVSNRREASVLNDAESVRVQGKVLPESKWRKDEDGEPVTTIRAKKVYVLD